MVKTFYRFGSKGKDGVTFVPIFPSEAQDSTVVPSVSLKQLIGEGKATLVNFESNNPANTATFVRGIGFNPQGQLLVNVKTTTDAVYNVTYSPNKPGQTVNIAASLWAVNLNQPGCTDANGVNANCATVGEITLPTVENGQNSADVATNGEIIATNVGPIKPDSYYCSEDPTTPEYPAGTSTSQVSIIPSTFTGITSSDAAATHILTAPNATLKQIEIPNLEPVAVLGETKTLVASSVTTGHNDPSLINHLNTTVYVNYADSAQKEFGMADHPLCTITGLKLVAQLLISGKVDEKGEIISRDLVVAGYPSLNGDYEHKPGSVYIIQDIDKRKGATINLGARNLSKQGVYVQSGFHWGGPDQEYVAAGHNLISVIDQETILGDFDSTGLDSDSLGLDDLESTGLPRIQQKRILMVGSPGDSNAVLIDLDTVQADKPTRVTLVDSTGKTSDLGYSVAVASFSEQRTEQGLVVSEYPLVSSPSTGEIFVLDPKKVLACMNTHSGEPTAEVGIQTVSEKRITDAEGLCPTFGEGIFTGNEENPVGLHCTDASAPPFTGSMSNTLTLVDLGKTMDHEPSLVEKLEAENRRWVDIGAGLTYLSTTAAQLAGAIVGLLPAENENNPQYPIIVQCPAQNTTDTDTDIDSPDGLSPAAMVGIGITAVTAVGVAGYCLYNFFSGKKNVDTGEADHLLHGDEEKGSHNSYGGIN